MQQLAELISLFLTPYAIVVSSVVLYYYGKSSIGVAAKKRSSGCSLTFHDWLIVGIGISFLGKLLDNGYWAIPWALSFVGSPWRDFFFNSGVYFNIPDRQICTILAGLCHIKSVFTYRKENHGVDDGLGPIFLASTVLSITFVLTILFVRG